MNKKRGISWSIIILVTIIFVLQSVIAAETVGVFDDNVCCEKTKSGLYCQNVPQSSCADGVRAIRTSCDATSFCKGGFCYDSVEGTCLDNTPQIVCNANNSGTWSATKPAACNLGCCLLGDQASFVTLVRCKRLSSFLGLETNYNTDITSEVQCILTARTEEKGACVFEKDFEKTCVFTMRGQCNEDISTASSADNGENGPGTTFTRASSSNSGARLNSDVGTTSGTSSGTTGTGAGTTSGTSGSSTTSGSSGNSGTSVTGSVVSGNGSANGSSGNSGIRMINGSICSGNVCFYPGKLCSDETLGTNCGPTKQTMCVDGKEEVYFKDSCGNPANIYDASRVNDKSYWANIIDKAESCGANSANTVSGSCGNCNYLLGSYCREVSAGGKRPTFGDSICADLNCVEKNGKKRLHGESWCGFDISKNMVVDPKSSGVTDILKGLVQSSTGLGGGMTPVGSKYYRYICTNGKITVEPCADFRQEECLENVIQTSIGPFSQAACRVNRWQDCTAQKKTFDCLNTDKRDCTWLEGLEYTLMGTAMNGTSMDAASLAGVKKRIEQEVKETGEKPHGSCVPKVPPGLKFWEGNEAKGICGQANAVCDVTYEKGLIGDDWECTKNCECLSKGLEAKRAQLCTAMGDCGLNVNFKMQPGASKGYAVKVNKLETDSSSGGILG